MKPSWTDSFESVSEKSAVNHHNPYNIPHKPALRHQYKEMIEGEQATLEPGVVVAKELSLRWNQISAAVQC